MSNTSELLERNHRYLDSMAGRNDLHCDHLMLNHALVESTALIEELIRPTPPSDVVGRNLTPTEDRLVRQALIDSGTKVADVGGRSDMAKLADEIEDQRGKDLMLMQGDRDLIVAALRQSTPSPSPETRQQKNEREMAAGTRCDGSCNDGMPCHCGPATPSPEREATFGEDGYNPAYDEGITYAIRMLADLTGSKDWQMKDGSEDHESDVRDTIMDVLKCAGLYDDEDGKFALLSRSPAPGNGVARAVPSAAQISALDDASNACLELAAQHGFATGHGDTVADMIREFSGQMRHAAPQPVPVNGAGMPTRRQIAEAIADGWTNGNEKYEQQNDIMRMRLDHAALAVLDLLAAVEPAPGGGVERAAVIEECAKICDDVVARAERLMDDPKASRETLAAVANGASECAENVRALAQPEQASAPASVGVLREATEAMALAGARSIGNTIHTDNHVVRARACWAAMWAARDGIEEPKPRPTP